MNTVSLKSVREVLARHGLSAKKKLGQNFLTDENIIRKIVAAGNLSPTDTVVEIGPGVGAMTGHLAEAAGRVVCIELDGQLLPVLDEVLGNHHNVNVIHGDALKTDLDKLVGDSGQKPYKIVANLPYYITTPLVMHFLSKGFCISEMILMVQKEVAQRMAASPGGKDYGSLSVAVQYHCRSEIQFIVKPTVFYPRPEVESAVLKLTRRDRPAVSVNSEEFFFQMVRAAFNKRRKTLMNALANSPLAVEKERVQQALLSIGMDEQVRGEKLSLEQFAALANKLHF